MPAPSPERDGGAGPVRLEATIRGRVQGVGFRYYVLREAVRRGVAGWVANRPDGAVECVAEGDPHDLDELLDALRDGPAGADVERFEVRWLPATGGFMDFGVRSYGHRGD